MAADSDRLRTTGFCASCEAANPPHARYCNRCGARLDGTTTKQEERKLVSVLFVDLVGFTSRSDHAEPEDVRDVLQLYHTEAKERIEQYGGSVEKFIGDAVLAVFGAPVSHGDDAERAVRAGLRVLEQGGWKRARVPVLRQSRSTSAESEGRNVRLPA